MIVLITTVWITVIEYKGNLSENSEIIGLKKKFEIFKIIETEIPMDKRHNSKTDYKKLEEIVEKL